MDSQGPSQGEPDIALINELIEHVERSPFAVEARILLMQQYAQCGWNDAAEETALEVLQIDGSNNEAGKFLEGYHKPKASGQGTITHSRNQTEAQGSRVAIPVWRAQKFAILSPSNALKTLDLGYSKLSKDAELLLREMQQSKFLDSQNFDKHITDLAAISIGQVSSVVRTKPLDGLNAVAQAIVSTSQTNTSRALGIAMDDLQKTVKWVGISADSSGVHSSNSKRPTSSSDNDIRGALLNRVKGLKALLPTDLQNLVDSAMMHAEHELLHRNYVNDETMICGDPISQIPRANFWASEDGYAWDMEELAGALKSGDGIMRNPLTKEMFTRSDVRAIVRHPLGKGLAALQLEQSSLKRGVRPQTILQIDKLAKVLSQDMSEDGIPSRLAVEEFVSYLETLPEGEQKAIERLKVPAKDSHNGTPFDTTIGEAVADMQGNRVCSHKTGDFLTQAVKYLS